MHPREIVEEAHFRQDFEMFRRNYPELDEAYKSAKKILLDTPFIGTVIESVPDLRIYATQPVADMQGETQGFYIVYRLDVDHIYMHSIRKLNF